MNRDQVQKIINENRLNLTDNFGVKHLYLFGSVARNEQNNTGDVDFLVEFARPTGLFGLLKLQDFLETQLGCKVDLGTYNSLKPYMKKEVDKDLTLVT